MEVWVRNCWWWWTLCRSFWRLSSNTFLCELECFAEIKVGLAAGLYSGTSRPDLNRTPQALQRVFGPIGPVRHCGVLSAAQCRHFRGEEDDDESVLLLSLFLDTIGFWSSSVGVRWRSRVDQSHGAARDRLLRALPGRGVSGWKNGAFREGSNVSDEEEDSEAWVFVMVVGPDKKWRAWRSCWAENESSTKFDSHSNSANSSYCNRTPKL